MLLLKGNKLRKVLHLGVLSAQFGVQPAIVLMGVARLVGVIVACAYAWGSTTTRRQPAVTTLLSIVDEREGL
jgi:uncharacterized membrane protein